jgi:plastocyanin
MPPQTWTITIDQATGQSQATFNPVQPFNPAAGDLIFWSNNTPDMHWPTPAVPAGTPLNNGAWMPSAIGPNGQSGTVGFPTAGTFNYVCALHSGESGQIVVS